MAPFCTGGYIKFRSTIGSKEGRPIISEVAQNHQIGEGGAMDINKSTIQGRYSTFIRRLLVVGLSLLIFIAFSPTINFIPDFDFDLSTVSYAQDHGGGKHGGGSAGHSGKHGGHRIGSDDHKHPGDTGGHSIEDKIFRQGGKEAGEVGMSPGEDRHSIDDLVFKGGATGHDTGDSDHEHEEGKGKGPKFMGGRDSDKDDHDHEDHEPGDDDHEHEEGKGKGPKFMGGRGSDKDDHDHDDHDKGSDH